MWPTLKPGDELYFVHSDKLRIGDIIGYQSRQMGIIHRIISIDGEYIYTKGDNCPISDEDPVKTANIRGKLIKINRDGAVIIIKNGFPGRLVGQKCSLHRNLKSFSISICRLLLGKKLMKEAIRDRIMLSDDDFTIIKQSDTLVKIYHLKNRCGYYCLRDKRFSLRYRYDLLISDSQKVKLQQTIEMMAQDINVILL